MLSKFILLFKNKIIPNIRYFFLVYIPKHLLSITHSKVRRVTLLLIILLMLISVAVMSKTLKNTEHSIESQPTFISYREFIEHVESGSVLTIIDYTQSSKKITGKLYDNTLFITDNPQSSELKKYLLENGIRLEEKAFIETIPQILLNVVLSFLPMVFIILVIVFLMGHLLKKQYSGNKDSKFNITKNCSLTFENVAGNEEAKENMMELVEFLTRPERFLDFGVIAPKGTVLFGPPGTGKTLLAKALAGTAGVPFIAVSGSDFVEKFVGVGASRIRQLFQFARKASPCIIFIDEIDALGKRTSSEGGSSDERDRTLNQILVEIDGFSGSEGIIVIAATNRLDMLDPALLRSGRFDRQIQVDLPDVDARYAILNLHSKNKPLNSDVDLKEVAKMTVYMSGADLANLMNEAGIYAVRNSHPSITMKDIDLAISKIQAGEEKRNKKNITLKDKEITAYHEAGHVLVAKLLSGTTVSKVTIIPTTKGAGGYTLFLQDEKMFSTKKDLLNNISIFLGGRASEEIIFGDNEVTNGASNDLRKATQIAVDMVKNFGMSQNVGLVSFLDISKHSSSGTSLNSVEGEVKKIIEDVYKETKELLKNNTDCLRNIANLLLERETIYRKDIDNIVESTMFDRGHIM